MSDLQKEDNKETSENEETGRVETQAPPPIPQFKKEGVEAKLIRQNDDYVYLKVYLKDSDREWYEINGKYPKNKISRVGG
jgi:hypothetical protein